MPAANQLLRVGNWADSVVTVHGPCTRKTLSPEGWQLWTDTLQLIRDNDFTYAFQEGCYLLSGWETMENIHIRGLRLQDQPSYRGMNDWETCSVIFFGRMCDLCWALTEGGFLYRLPLRVGGLVWQRTDSGKWWANCLDISNPEKSAE
jgi:hypothetical protein